LFTDFDAYRILQIDPRAEWFVLAAAYRALARRYHPDGAAPNHERMAEINRAYALVRTPEQRLAYDRQRLTPVGPGPAASTGPVVVPMSRFDASARREATSGDAPSDGTPVLEFGRYAGWSLRALSRHDPDYLRWLMRHSSGVRYRNEISKLLPRERAPEEHVKAGR
jgi:curved DNA-binding protein CbpA